MNTLILATAIQSTGLELATGMPLYILLPLIMVVGIASVVGIRLLYKKLNK